MSIAYFIHHIIGINPVSPTIPQALPYKSMSVFHANSSACDPIRVLDEFSCALLWLGDYSMGENTNSSGNRCHADVNGVLLPRLSYFEKVAFCP